MRKVILSSICVLTLLLLFSCKNDKYISNRFAGVYKITSYKSEVWDSLGLRSSTTYPCNYVFYFTANDNDFGNGACKIDTSGVAPSFLGPLFLEDHIGFDRFTMQWNFGTSDNDRLSLIKNKDLIQNSVIVNIKRNKLGKVKSFTYFYYNTDGSYTFDEFEVEK